ncbi:helix-turn-helix transcriptional regulator [Paenibacillus monticola]|uniref:WYL domain-containing protein n=1 Tax=Paenibacillus monticola TaxID=2666075 RepID=A0A7X2H3A8_9BACL|nr:YafY family protein [Paenibacillus monticola]MRN52605.1 WYL domain-containing protein [Paenibacillus monticola]
MEKIERMIAIVMILLQKEIISATAFSRLFNVSKRTILRDMETLCLSNIPIYSIHGAKGGYAIMDEYKIDKRLLSSSDLENILVALSGLEQIFISLEVEVTIKKIESMVRGTVLKNTIHLSFHDWNGRDEMQEALSLCQQAIRQHVQVTFDYIDKNGVPTARTVEPYQLHFNEMSWYLIGFCLTRMEYRTFKLFRIDNLVLDKKSYVPRSDAADQGFAEGIWPKLTKVRALISPAIKDQFIERYGSKCIEPHSAEWLSATIHIPQNQISFRHLSGFGTELKIVAPLSYVEEFQRYVAEILNHYR